MIDYESIGRRIAEERRRFRKISQEQMAEDLGMYQADISNLERARKGSGITDLSRLDLIADYFNMPLENLIFGSGRGNRMETYHGKKMELQEKGKKGRLPAAHKKLLQVLIGPHADISEVPLKEIDCGPYIVYVGCEYQTMIGASISDADGNEKQVNFRMEKLHFYTFYDNEAIATMTVAVTSTFQHMHMDAFQLIRQLIQRETFDLRDVRSWLNPYWLMWEMTEPEEGAGQYREPMEQRFKDLHYIGEIPVLYIENVYVREDCRQKGMFRMLLDSLRMLVPDSIIWLNMEPTSGDELTTEYDYYPSYTPSELGQINMNASIAEKLGFTVDPDTWHREAEILDDDGNTKKEIVLIRKCAFYMPKKIRELLKDDGDLIALGRAKQKIWLEAHRQDEPEQVTIDLNSDIKDGYVISEIKIEAEGDSQGYDFVWCYAACNPDTDSFRFGVAKRSVVVNGLEQEDFLEFYEYLDDAMDSLYWETLFMLHSMTMMHCGGLQGEDDSDAE